MFVFGQLDKFSIHSFAQNIASQCPEARSKFASQIESELVDFAAVLVYLSKYTQAKMHNLQNTFSNAKTVQTWVKNPQNLDSNHAVHAWLGA